MLSMLAGESGFGHSHPKEAKAECVKFLKFHSSGTGLSFNGWHEEAIAEIDRAHEVAPFRQ